MRRVFLSWAFYSLAAMPMVLGDAGILLPADKQQPDPSVLSLDEMSIRIRIDNGHARVFRQRIDRVPTRVANGDVVAVTVGNVNVINAGRRNRNQLQLRQLRQSLTANRNFVTDRYRCTGQTLDDLVRSGFTKLDPLKARIVELRHFGGLSVEETAEVLKISEVTVMRHWSLAKSWLRRAVRG